MMRRVILVTESHSILARWRNHFTQLLNEHGIGDVRQTETHTTEPLAREPSAFEFEMAIEKLKRRKSPGTGQIPTQLIKAEGRINRSEIRKLTKSILSMEKLPEERTETIILLIGKKDDKTDSSDYTGMSLLSTK